MVPWNTFTEEEMLDLLDQYTAVENATNHPERISWPTVNSISYVEVHNVETSQVSVISLEVVNDNEKATLTSITSSYANKSLKAFEDAKFPSMPITYKEMKSLKLL